MLAVRHGYRGLLEGKLAPIGADDDLVDLPTVLAATKQLPQGQSPLARWRASAFDDLEDMFLL